jgi:histidinol dehydrogenase
LRDFTARFDGAAPQNFALSIADRDSQAAQVSAELAAAIDVAIANISSFHATQLQEEIAVETAPGVVCFRKKIPIGRVAVYVPGGSAPLFSTLLMLVIPAKLAGVREIVLATPGGKTATIPPVIALCAQRLGIDEIYLMGGAQAIAALAYGTESIPRVDKICGPGNQFVTEAKVQVSSAGIPIDMPAGPSEALVIADSGANPRYVAADLLAQAEHGVDSQAVLVTTDRGLVRLVEEEIARQLERLPRKNIAEQVMARANAVVLPTVADAVAFSNVYAPEHLLLSVEDPERYVPLVQNAGSVFLGYFAAESLGDYASGTNHVLPTNRFATGLSGVSIDSFVKAVTFQRVDRRGLRGLGPTVVEMARAEGLEAHAQAVVVRMEDANGL